MDNPFRATVSDEALAEWMAQFDQSEQEVVKSLVSNFRYYGPEDVNNKLKILYGKILLHAATVEANIYFVPVGYVAKSGAAIAYFFKTQNDISQHQFVLPSDLESMIPDSKNVIVFLDDYIGSGQQARQVWDGLNSINPSLIERSKIIFAAIVAREKGIEHLRENSKFDIVTVDVIGDNDVPLSETSVIFPDVNTRSFASHVIEKYGKMLKPDAPFGYDESQGLIGFFYSTPNNTLPIFWSTESGWRPLLPHKESFRDPSALFGPPSGLPSVGGSGGINALLEISELDAYEIDHQIAIKVLNEFKRLDILLVLTPIIKQMKFRYEIFSKLIEIISELKIFAHERIPVSSSILIVPDGCPDDAFGTLVLMTDGNVFIDSIKKIESIVSIIDGDKGGLFFTREGVAQSLSLFRDVGGNDYPMLPTRYHRISRATLDARALAFAFSGDGKASAFYCGKRILVFRGASWHLQPSGIEDGISNLARRAEVNSDALRHVFRLASELSDKGDGALITIGDHKSVLEFAEDPLTNHMVWSEVRLGVSPIETIIGLAKQDGATIVDSEGMIVQGMTFLRPPKDAGGKLEIGKGSKHSSAANITKVTKCLALAVSVDGQITIYLDGEIVFKLMG